MNPEPPGPVSALPPRVIRLFLLQRIAGGMALQMQAVAVGWYVYALTSSPLDLGFIGLVQFVPTAGLALAAGHFVDRHPRRFVLLAAQALELACYLALAAVAYSGADSVGLVFLVVAGLGVARAFDHPAQASLLPGLVPAGLFPAVRPVTEEAGSHVVPLGGDRVLIAASAPRTAGLLEDLGFTPVVVDISEFEKLEGCVTCLSVLLPGR